MRPSRTLRLLLPSLLLALFALHSPTAAQLLRLGGQIVDLNGEPIPGARVALLAYPSPYRVAVAQLEGGRLDAVTETRTGPEGRFELEVPGAGMWLLRARARSHAEVSLPLTPLLASRELRPIALPPSAELAVVVMDRRGSPIPAATVVLVARREQVFEPTREHAAPRPQAARTDDAGQARLIVPKRAPFDLGVAAAGYVFWHQEGLDERATEVRLEPGRPRTLTVEGEDGRPVGGAIVLAEDGEAPLARTDAEGRAVLSLDPEAEATRLALRVLAADGSAGFGLLDATSESVVRTGLVPLRGRVVLEESRVGVAGALVWDQGNPAAPALTDDDGAYELDAVPRRSDHPPTLQAAAAGTFPAKAAAERSAIAAGTGPTLVLEPASSVAGTVEDEDGSPLAGVEVRLQPGLTTGFNFRDTAAAARSGSDGSFELSPVALEGSLRLAAKAAGYALTVADVPPRRPERPAALTVVMRPGRGAYGTVVDEADRAIAGAEVTLRATLGGGSVAERLFARSLGFDEVHEASSDGEGRFTFSRLNPGRYDLRAEAVGFAPSTVPAVLIPEGEATSEIGTVVLGPGVAVEGIVTDSAARALGGAEVRVEADEALYVRSLTDHRRDPDAVTDAGGRFTLSDLAAGGRLRLEVRLEGYASASLAGVQAPTDEPIEIRLETATRLRGEVVDESGDPLPQVALRLVRQQEARSGEDLTLGNLMRHGSSDGSGRFEITELLPGRWDLTASAPRYQETHLDGISLEAVGDPSEVRVVMRKGAVVRGKVYGPGGEPVVGAQVLQVVEETSRFVSRSSGRGGRADSDGRYHLDGLPTGRLSLAAEHPEHQRQVRDLEVRQGENLLDFQLEAGREIRGRVVGPDHEPVAGARVEAVPPSPPVAIALGPFRSQRGEPSGEDGGFVLQGLSDGDYVVSAHKEGYATARSEELVHLEGDSVEGLELQLQIGAAIFGTVTGLSFDELSMLQVVALQFGGSAQPLMAQVDHEGEYRIDNLRPGDWTIVAMVGRGGKMRQRRVTLDPGTSELRLDLELGGGLVLSGQVLRTGGEPARGHSLYVTGRTTTSAAQATTDQEGRFSIAGLEEDTYQLSVGRHRGASHQHEVELLGDREVLIELVELAVGGRVVDAGDRTPIEGAEMTLLPLDGDRRGATFGFGAPPRSDRSGSFRLRGLHPGLYRLQAKRDGYAAGSVDLEIGGHDVEGVEIALAPAAGLTLFVLDPIGEPVEAAEIIALDAGDRPILNGAFGAGEGGRIRLEQLPAGSWALLVGGSGAGTVERQVQVPGESVTLQLPPVGSLRITLPDLVGSGLRGQLTLRDERGRPYRFIAMRRLQQEWTIADGIALLPSLPAGRWTLEARAGARTWSGTVRVVAGAMVETVLD